MNPGLEKILERIRAEAEAEAAAILREAETAAAQTLAAAREEAESLRTAAREEVNSRRAKETQKLLANARIQVRRAREEAREEGLRSVLTRLEELLREFITQGEISGTKYFSYLLKSLLAAAPLLGPEFEIVLAPADRERFGKELVPALVEAARKSGREIHPRLSEAELPAAGGALILSDGGRVRVDQTFSSRIKNIRPELRALAARQLFPEGNPAAKADGSGGG